MRHFTRNSAQHNEGSERKRPTKPTAQADYLLCQLPVGTRTLEEIP
jgi:hypothetical protein